MVKKDNSNPVPTRIGMGLLILGGIILSLPIRNQINQGIKVLISFLMMLGLLLAWYGLTNVDVKGNKKYQNLIRVSSKVFLIISPLAICLAILGVLIPQMKVISLIVLGAMLLMFFIFDIYFIISTYEYIKKKKL